MSITEIMAGAMIFIFACVIVMSLLRSLPYIAMGAVAIVGFWIFLKIGVPLLCVIYTNVAQVL